MKLSINIVELLGGRAVDDDRIEYKTGWNPDAIYRSICAFANDFDKTGDGYIVMGVMEKNGFAFCHPEFVSEKVVLNKDVIKDVTKKLSESQILLLKRLSETGQWNALENVLETSSTLAAYFGVNPRTIRRDISVLQAKGVIKHDGPDKGGR